METPNALSYVKVPGPVLTVYVDTNPRDRNNQGRAPSYLNWLKDEGKSIGSEVPAQERKLFRKQLDRVENFLREQTSHQDALLIFAGPTTWEQLSIAKPLKNELHWGRPALAQLLGILDDQKPCCVVTVDCAGAQFFRHYLGKVTKLSEQKFSIDTSQWKEAEHAHMARRATRMPHGPQQDSFDRRMNDEYRHLYRRVAQETRNLCVKERLFSVFLVGSKRLTEPIESQLPGQLRKRTELFDQDLAGVTVAKLQAIVTPLIAAAANGAMMRRVDDLLNADRGAVLGLDETLAQLQNGTISTLILVHGLDAGLRQCVKCGLTSGAADPVCNSCGGMRKRTMLSEVLPELARATDIEIEIVSGEAAAKLSKSGGIGGWLRQRRKTRETSRARA